MREYRLDEYCSRCYRKTIVFLCLVREHVGFIMSKEVNMYRCCHCILEDDPDAIEFTRWLNNREVSPADYISPNRYIRDFLSEKI